MRPALDASNPQLAHAVFVLGRGSEVLGYDDAMSTDHDWNARLLLFLAEEDLPGAAELSPSMGQRLHAGTGREREIADRCPVGGIDQTKDVLWGPDHRELVLRLLEWRVEATLSAARRSPASHPGKSSTPSIARRRR